MAQNQNLTTLIDKFVEGMTGTSMSWGLSKVASQIFAYLNTYKGPICLNQIVDELKISKGNVSVNIRLLEELGAVKKVWVKGDRKDHYQAVMDFWTLNHALIKRNYTSDIHTSLDSINQTINGIQEILASATPDERDRLRHLMQKLQNQKVFYSYVSDALIENDRLNKDINIVNLRNIWNFVKQTLKKS